MSLFDKPLLNSEPFEFGEKTFTLYQPTALDWQVYLEAVRSAYKAIDANQQALIKKIRPGDSEDEELSEEEMEARWRAHMENATKDKELQAWAVAMCLRPGIPHAKLEDLADEYSIPQVVGDPPNKRHLLAIIADINARTPADFLLGAAIVAYRLAGVEDWLKRSNEALSQEEANEKKPSTQTPASCTDSP